jgi:NADPH:quinone reductase-like Zn-dependent oxidoreductase
MPSPELAQKYNIEARFVSSNLSAKNLENGLILVLKSKIKPIIAKTFPLAEAARAQDFVSAGGMNGKVVLEVG